MTVQYQIFKNNKVVHNQKENIKGRGEDLVSISLVYLS